MSYYQRIDAAPDGTVALYTEVDGALLLDSFANEEDARLTQAVPLRSLFLNALLIYCDQPALTFWETSSKHFDDASKCFARYDFLLKCQQDGILYREELLPVTNSMSIAIRKKYFGFATQIDLEGDSCNNMLYWFWNHGTLAKAFDVAPDVWFEPEEYDQWALEMASLISKATKLKAYSKEKLPPVLID